MRFQTRTGRSSGQVNVNGHLYDVDISGCITVEVPADIEKLKKIPSWRELGDGGVPAGGAEAFILAVRDNAELREKFLAVNTAAGVEALAQAAGFMVAAKDLVLAGAQFERKNPGVVEGWRKERIAQTAMQAMELVEAVTPQPSLEPGSAPPEEPAAAIPVCAHGSPSTDGSCQHPPVTESVGDEKSESAPKEWKAPAKGEDWPDPSIEMPVKFLRQMCGAYKVKYSGKDSSEALVEKLKKAMYE